MTISRRRLEDARPRGQHFGVHNMRHSLRDDDQQLQEPLGSDGHCCAEAEHIVVECSNGDICCLFEYYECWCLEIGSGDEKEKAAIYLVAPLL